MDYTLIITESLAGRQWKSILRSQFGASARLLHKMTQTNGVYVNGLPVYLTARANTGDKLCLTLPKETPTVTAEPQNLDIAYEDAEILVVNKPPGMLTHPSARERYGSLLAAAQARLTAEELVPHCVHRLDRDTSGLVMLAKHAHVHHLYDLALRQGLIHRTYAAIVHWPSEIETNRAPLTWQTIDLPIAQDPNAPSKRRVGEEGKAAVTHYAVVAQAGGYALVVVLLETGRTHQIRAHFAAIGHPLAGEPHYQGTEKEQPQSGLRNRRPNGALRRQALHAIRLTWRNPFTDITRCATAAPPADLVRFWCSLGGDPAAWGRVAEIEPDVSGKMTCEGSRA